MRRINALQSLAEQLRTLPGVGPKLAIRLAFHVVDMQEKNVEQLSEALLRVKKEVFHCSLCFHITDCEPCKFCADERRDRSILCVVESPRDVEAMERTRDYHGLYHVLHGVLSPLSGVSPDDIKLKELFVRLQREDFKELILATNPNVEGEATALYIAKLLENLPIKVTRIGHGVPVGSDIEYADEITLSKSLENRKRM